MDARRRERLSRRAARRTRHLRGRVRDPAARAPAGRTARRERALSRDRGRQGRSRRTCRGPARDRLLTQLDLTGLTPRTRTRRADVDQEWRDVARKGVAINQEETIVGAIFIAGAIFDAEHAVCGSISVGLPKARYTPAVGRRIASHVKDSCARLSASLVAGRLSARGPAAPRAALSHGGGRRRRRPTTHNSVQSFATRYTVVSSSSRIGASPANAPRSRSRSTRPASALRVAHTVGAVWPRGRRRRAPGACARRRSDSRARAGARESHGGPGRSRSTGCRGRPTGNRV